MTGETEVIPQEELSQHIIEDFLNNVGTEQYPLPTSVIKVSVKECEDFGIELTIPYEINDSQAERIAKLLHRELYRIITQELD